MKLTKEQLRQIIKEEIGALSEMVHHGHPINAPIMKILKLYRDSRSSPEDQELIRQAVGELQRSMFRQADALSDEEVGLELVENK